MCLRARGCAQASGAILPIIPVESNGPKVLDFGHLRGQENELCGPGPEHRVVGNHEDTRFHEGLGFKGSFVYLRALCG